MATLLDAALFRSIEGTEFDRIRADMRAQAAARPCLAARWTRSLDGRLAPHWDFDLTPPSQPSG